MEDKKTNSERMFELQEEHELSDEDLGMKAIEFIFDPDEAGKATEFVDFLERTVDED